MSLRDALLGPPRPQVIRVGVTGPGRRSLIAASQPATRMRREGRQLFQPWQAEALAYYDRLGECRYPAQFHAAMLSRVRLYLGRRDESGEIEEIEDSKGILQRLEDPGGGHSSLLSPYGALRFVAGESFLLNTADEEDRDGELFEIVSPLELRLKPGSKDYQRVRAPGLTPEELLSADEEELDLLDIGEARVWRFHRRHPTYSDWADSPVRTVLTDYEELLLLKLEARSQVKSRIARAGILFLDGRLSFTTAGAGEDEAEPEGTADEDAEADELLEALIEAFIAARDDEGSAAGVAPVIARVENGTGLPLKDLVFHLRIHEPEDTYPASARIKEVREGIAIAIDLPKEILLGLTDANHWTAWSIDDSTWEQHGEPDAIAFCQDITDAYVRPKAEAEKVEDWEDIVCWYDAAAVTTDPDRSKNAKDLYRDGEISGEGYRNSLGFSDDDEPSEDERRRYAAFRLRDRSLLPGEEAADEEDTGRDIPTEEPVAGEPEPEAPPEQGLAASANGQLEDALRGAAEFALYRGRELAGSKLLGLRRSCEECFAGSEGVSKDKIAAYLGETTVRELVPDTDSLVSGVGKGFAEVALRLGVEPDRAHELALVIQRHAAETLTDDDPAPVPL